MFVVDVAEVVVRYGSSGQGRRGGRKVLVEVLLSSLLDAHGYVRSNSAAEPCEMYRSMAA